MTLTVTTVNLNGIRAAHKRGFLDWLGASDTDVLLMQEVRAPEEISREIMGGLGQRVGSLPHQGARGRGCGRATRARTPGGRSPPDPRRC